MVGVGRKPRQLEIGNDAFVAIAELPCRTDQPLLDHPADDAEALQHVERGGMKRRSAQVARQVLACLDQRDRNSLIDQQVGGDEPDGAGTDNNHVLHELSSHRACWGWRIG